MAKKTTKRKRVEDDGPHRFYVGAEGIGEQFVIGHSDVWTRQTFEQAVKHAQEIMEEEDRESCIIVKIVGVVKRQKSPVTVIRLP